MSRINIDMKDVKSILIFIANIALSLVVVTTAGAATSSKPCVHAVASKKLLTTKAVAKLADPELVREIQALEKAGARGGWFKSQVPLAADHRVDYFYLLQKAPSKVFAATGIFIMREARSLQYLTELIQQGRPIVFGNIQEVDRAAAMALTPDEELADTVRRLQTQARKSVILLGLTSDKFTLAHEAQHATDFDDKDFMSSLDTELNQIAKLPYLADRDLVIVQEALVEIRGYSAQEVAYKLALQHQEAFVNRAGNVMPADPTEYNFRISNVVNRYKSEYGSKLRYVFEKIKSHSLKDYETYVATISKYDLSANALTTLSIPQILKIK